jgi:hypothetical protein
LSDLKKSGADKHHCPPRELSAIGKRASVLPIKQLKTIQDKQCEDFAIPGYPEPLVQKGTTFHDVFC